MNHDKLLDTLSEKGHLMISDLKDPRNLHYVLHLFGDLPDGSYTPEEANYLLNYIYDVPFSYASLQEIHEFIQKALSGSSSGRKG